MRLRLLAVVAGLLVASGAGGAWVVTPDGACVERWEASDMLRGPAAVLNGSLRPLRTLPGGAEYAWNTEEWWPWQIIALGPAVTVVSGAAGALEGVWWMCTGLADTVTGGYFALSPDEAAHVSLRPEVSALVADAGPTPAPAHDRCGRPL